jgi:tRNA pseudouridine32 synthase/23S rRNA pseudouridine746 synthase
MPENPKSTIAIVFEHDDFLIIDKPVGVAMHSSDRQVEGLATSPAHRLPSSIIPLMRAQLPEHDWHLVHRLDTATSGCLLLAKHKAAASALSQLFAQRRIDKFYLALSDKKPKKKQGLVKGDMQKARGGDLKLSKTLNNPAITQYFSASHTPGVRAFLCKPHTGKTHQIRVALKSQGAPIIGDSRYGGSQAQRMYLFSYGMRFEYQSQAIEVIHLADENEHLHAQRLPSAWQTPWHMDWPVL